MTAVISLGSFEQVRVREAWPAVDTNCTPWLASAENMSLLGDALNMDLTVDAVEHSVVRSAQIYLRESLTNINRITG